MRARFAYPLLFLLPSAMAAFLVAVVAGGAGAGILWLYVHGDDAWPASAEIVVMTVAIVALVATLATLLFCAYLFGKRRETQGGPTRWHVALAMLASVLLPAIALLHQWRIGNLG